MSKNKKILSPGKNPIINPRFLLIITVNNLIPYMKFALGREDYKRLSKPARAKFCKRLVPLEFIGHQFEVLEVVAAKHCCQYCDKELGERFTFCEEKSNNPETQSVFYER